MTGHQRRLVAEFEDLDPGGRFARHPWRSPGLGHGEARTLEDGGVFERAAVNVSVLRSRDLHPVAAPGPELAGREYSAASISMVLHAVNPYVPSFHANFRYFEVSDADGEWWLGGGMDMTPSYGFETDAESFHKAIKRCCDEHEIGAYQEWKKNCDEYFYVKHRGEMRGVGGVFFDHLTGSGADRTALAAFTGGALTAISEAYLPIVRRRMGTPYGDAQRNWQLARRGRYVEFNLVYDIGTTFGLNTGVDADNVLASLPPVVRWSRGVVPEPGSAEERLSSFLQPRDWAGDR
ncbi:oxygen-dependent coproporphyrinogen oxidase [Actinomadura darangshiensis]|uniref:coproporphyrinogen oxidase n=2 Tax=Actinomadura darangshiensis TaxID=705336 RepID=A0A4R5BZ36_9ACTN|nr:oxygen-dependent coproporphyrinogen oxidase [Actinomadura darangshiensis]